MSQKPLRRGNWSVQELERLRLLLPHRGVEQTAVLLRRSADSVLRKALDLLRVPPRKGAWTDSDDWQLRQAWGAVELRLLAPMLGRPSSEVRRRASELRRRTQTGEWARAEVQLLKKLYGTRSDADLEVSLMRDRREIAEVAKQLCLAKDKRFRATQGLGGAKIDTKTAVTANAKARRSRMPRWTSAEVEQLRRLYPDQDNLTVARALGRTVTSVANKAYQLGIHKTPALLTSIGRSNIAYRYADDQAAEANARPGKEASNGIPSDGAPRRSEPLPLDPREGQESGADGV